MIKRIIAGLLDEMIAFILATVGLLVVEGVLRICGYTMLTPLYFFIITFFVANALYYPLIEGSKYGTTIGKRVLKLDENKIETITEVKTEQ